MDYEKAFKEAYERASLRFGTNVANELFLEYKESKEERTRRKLIEFFSDWSKTKSHCWGIRVTDIMDWLEKQGQKPALKESDETAEAFARIIRAHLIGIDSDVQYEFEQLYKEITGKKMYQGYKD